MQTYRTRDEAIEAAREDYYQSGQHGARIILRIRRRYSFVPDRTSNASMHKMFGDLPTQVGVLWQDSPFESFTGNRNGNK